MPPSCHHLLCPCQSCNCSCLCCRVCGGLHRDGGYCRSERGERQSLWTLWTKTRKAAPAAAVVLLFPGNNWTLSPRASADHLCYAKVSWCKFRQMEKAQLKNQWITVRSSVDRRPRARVEYGWTNGMCVWVILQIMLSTSFHSSSVDRVIRSKRRTSIDVKHFFSVE